jgi:chromosome segregation ATPase
MDILNGTGRIMDHDAVIAALNRTTNFLTNEETMFSWKMEQLELKHKQNMEEQGTKYETLIDKKNQQIKELKRLLQQEKKATSNLASKVIQTETLAQQKMVSEKRYMIMLEKMEGEMLDLNAANSVRTTKIVELEETIESDRKTIVELMEVIGTLRSELTSICMEEEHNLVKAEANLKAMFETQYVFLKETEKRKEMMRDRLLTLGISLSGCMSEEEEEEEGEEEESEDEEQSEVIPVPPPDEPSDDEVARVALASAMQAVESLIQQEKEEVFVDDVPEVE